MAAAKRYASRGAYGNAYLLFKQVALVQEEDQTGILEPFRVDNLRKQLEGLVQPILRLVLVQHLIELGERSDKHDGVDIIKAMDPLASLVTLATNVEPDTVQSTQHG
jgi:hypothetical protein